MRWPILAFSLMLLPSCTAWDRSVGASRYRTPLTLTKADPEHPLANLDPDFPVAPGARIEPSSSSAPAPAPKPPRPRQPAKVQRVTSRGVALTVFLFDDREFALSVADKSRGPDTEWQSARAAADAHHAVAAINASFFTPEGNPLGLVIENRTRTGSWNRSSSLTSGVLVVQHGQPRLLRRQASPPPSTAEHLVQAGPLLLERASAVSGLSNRSQRPRSFLACDHSHRWVLGHTPSSTLADLAAALAAQPVPGLTLRTALNLDGGRSADLWVSQTIKGGPVSTRRLWNKPVRNYVLVRKRTSP